MYICNITFAMLTIFMYTQGYKLHSQYYITITTLHLQILHSKQNLCSHQIITLYSLLPLNPVTSSLLFMSMHLPILGISHRWDHIIFVLLCLACFTEHNVLRFTHCSVHVSIYSSARLSNIPLDGFTVLCIHSPVNEH